jgi:phosphoserine phosphatase
MVELPSNCPIVLVDWDNTFRKGFTVITWVEFLAESGLFSELDTIRATVDEFQRGALAYEAFCNRMALAYAVGLAGQLESDVFAAGASFVAADSAQLFSFVAPLCAYLVERNFKVIVVSGAPEELLKHYAKAVDFELGGALHLEVKSGRYTGGIVENCGLSDEKEAAVGRLSKSNEVVAAMGDSTSDLPC